MVTNMGSEMQSKRFNFEQRCNFRRACRLNNPKSLTDLRSLYLSCRSGMQFGRCSGYQP
jgi:hypothetical protein